MEMLYIVQYIVVLHKYKTPVSLAMYHTLT